MPAPRGAGRCALGGDAVDGDGGGVKDREFMTMSRMFGKHGGMVTADELVHSMRRNLAQPLSIVARWIAKRAAVQFAWRSQTWFPFFQLQATRCRFVLPCPRSFWRCATPAMTGSWRYGSPAPTNGWDYAPPVEVIRCDPAAAVGAARIDRLIAK